MDITWTVGMLSAGAENVQPLAGGKTTTRADAAEAASDALVVAAMDRGRQEYRVRVADTLIVVIPGLTERGDVDLLDLAETVPGFEQARRLEPEGPWGCGRLSVPGATLNEGGRDVEN